MKSNRYLLIWAIIFVVLIIDQALKIYVKTNLQYGTGFGILGLEWARIHFVENEGMAFGITFGNKCLGFTSDTGNCIGLQFTAATGKLLLSVFRIIMIGFLIYLLNSLYKSKEPLGLLISFGLILAGAIGNIIDSIFYGVIFSASYYHGGLAELFPAGGGYAPLLHGKVVDMFYFPMFDTILPEWIPIYGGKRFEFFRHVFNVADSAIFIGVCLIIIFYRDFLWKSTTKEKTEAPTLSTSPVLSDDMKAE